MNNYKKIFKKGIFLLIICFILFWKITLIKCELLTLLYGKEFPLSYIEDVVQTENMHVKVLSYNAHQAEVYYVEKWEIGVVLVFMRDDILSTWEVVDWKATWSSSGSADDLVWPYIR